VSQLEPQGKSDESSTPNFLPHAIRLGFPDLTLSLVGDQHDPGAGMAAGAGDA
jgi:hypothetical protein